MKTAIAYVRVSTEDQATEGVSIEAQKAKLAAWCLINDCELVATYVDAGLSGGRADNRPGLQAAIEQASKTKSVLVVYLAKSSGSIGQRHDCDRREARQGRRGPCFAVREDRHDFGGRQDDFSHVGRDG